jgi:hypothetical protein
MVAMIVVGAQVRAAAVAEVQLHQLKVQTRVKPQKTRKAPLAQDVAERAEVVPRHVTLRHPAAMRPAPNHPLVLVVTPLKQVGGAVGPGVVAMPSPAATAPVSRLPVPSCHRHHPGPQNCTNASTPGWCIQNLYR